MAEAEVSVSGPSIARGTSLAVPCGAVGAKQKSPPKRAFLLQRKQEVAHRSGLTEFTALRALADP
ncbi:hypothetical protein R69888_04766 [Paraburkholderia haematera]|uniref:Uncharacterized protein n=1 Tax=Paraburkholderia haematera TaxID=2793077 RepID=A0ABM8S646_9BURK|nr:hypothetical protein R69888_04766 [Paraburkholderia haematera]